METSEQPRSQSATWAALLVVALLLLQLVSGGLGQCHLESAPQGSAGLPGGDTEVPQCCGQQQDVWQNERTSDIIKQLIQEQRFPILRLLV